MNVLDHGFVRLVDSMGDDAAVVQAARVSYGEGTTTARSDRGLIRYLMRHWHSTPFEMVEFKFHMALPIFVARQLIRYRTANVNEYSARYSVMKDKFYIPDVERIGKQSKSNKQGTGAALTQYDAAFVQKRIETISYQSYQEYAEWTNEEGLDIARETARMILPVNVYTEWYWKTDLHNLFHVIHQRADGHAQWEIQQYAKAMLEIIKPIVPVSVEAFFDYRMNARTFSAQEMEIVRHALARLDTSEKLGELSDGEWREFLEKLK